MKGARSAGLALLLGLVLSEAAVRLGEPDRFGGRPLLPFDVVEPIRSGMRLPQESTYLVFDPELGWQVGASRRERNGLYHSDALGRRVAPSGGRGGEPWAAAFGDSFTHGDDVGDQETWLARLSVAGLPTANWGVPGYGVDQAWLRYRRVKNDLGARVVLIGVMADNLGRHLNRYRPFITPAERIFFVKPRFELSGGQLQLIRSPFAARSHYARAADVLRAELFEVGRKDHFFDPAWYEPGLFDRSKLLRIVRTLARARPSHADWRSLYQDEAAVELTLAIIAGFVDEVRRDQRQPVIVFLPEKTVVEDVLAGRTPPTADFLSRLKRLPCPLIDFTTPAVRFAGGAGRPEPFVPHYSPALSQAIADYVIEWKKTEKSLP